METNIDTESNKMSPVRTKYTKQTPKSFFDWLDRELEDRGWSERRLCEEADLSHSVISKSRSGLQPIGYDAAKAIAGALKVTDVFVLRKAGLIEKEPESSDKRDQLDSYFDQLPEDDQDDLLQMALTKLLRTKQKEKTSGKMSTRKAGAG